MCQSELQRQRICSDPNVIARSLQVNTQAHQSTVNPFQEQPLIAPGFFRRLFGRPVPENGYIAVENLLAHKAWHDLHEGDISSVLLAHGVKRFDRVRALKLFETALTTFLQDTALTDAEADNL